LTVTWEYVLNGQAYQVGSQTITLVPNNKYLYCHGGFSATYSSSSPVAMYTGWWLYGAVLVNSQSINYASVSVNAGTLTVAPYVVMQYGPDGLRSSELVNQGSVTQHFGYDLLGMGGVPQRVADYGGTALTSTYFYGVGSAQPLDMIVGGTSYYYHRDASGSITTLTDPSNNLAASYRYDAFGNLLQSADTVGNPNRWDALEWDTTTGLIHDGARFYDPVTGRHLTPDSTMGDPYGFMNVNDAQTFLQTLSPSPATPAPGQTSGDSLSASSSGGPATGPDPSICASLWFNFAIAVVLLIASMILSWAALTVAHETLPILFVISGFRVSGQIADLAAAYAVGNTGQLLSSLGGIFLTVLTYALAAGGLWFALGFMTRVVTIQFLIIQLILSAVFIGVAVYQLVAAHCPLPF